MEPELRRSLWHISNFIKPGYQVILMLVTSTLLLSLSYMRLKIFRNIDRSPGIVTVEGAVGANRHMIATGMNVRNFLKFDLFNNDFIVDVYLWFEFDPTKIQQQDIDDFSFGKATILSKSKPYVAKKGELTHLGYDIKIQFPSNLNYKFFPMSSHSLYLTLNNLSLASEQTLFSIQPSTFVVSKTLYINGWQFLDKGVTSGFKNLELNEKDTTQKKSFPRVIFTLDFLGIGFRDLILILLPLLVIFFIGLFTLCLDPKEHYSSIVSVVAATITALLSYRFVIETLSPKASYFMLGDRLFDLILVINFIIFLVGLLFLERLEKYRGLLIILFHLILIVGWVYLIFVWAM